MGENYRHQADVLNMYWILSKNGYDDDHIVLIIEDDIADTAVCSGLSSPAIAVEWPLPLTPIIASLPSPRQMPMRPSKADVHDISNDIWLSNRFTAMLHDCLTTNPSISMRDLYYRLFQNMVGSHVCLYGTEGYGNLYTSTMAEFVGR